MLYNAMVVNEMVDESRKSHKQCLMFKVD